MTDIKDFLGIKILEEGDFSEDKVTYQLLKKSEYEGMKFEKSHYKEAEKRFQRRRKANPLLFDGRAAHLANYFIDTTEKELHLFFAEISYKLYDIARKELKEKYGWEWIPTGVGINVCLITSDKWIVIHKRFAEVDHPQGVGLIGGIYTGEGGPFQEIKKEIREELGIQGEEIKRLKLLGISYREQERQNHELSFLGKLKLSKKEVAERQEKIEKSAKEGEVFFLQVRSKKLKEYLIDHCEELTISTRAALWLAGRYVFGKQWSKIN